jgi:lysophospholipase L1-like esterase
VRIRTNRLGMRGPEIAERKPEGVKRYLFLGDSVTFGVGMEEEETFLGLLNDRLGNKIEVWNAGVVGYNSIQEDAWLRKWGDEVSPDAVLLIYLENDSSKASLQTMGSGERPEAVREIINRVPLLKRKILSTQANLYTVFWLQYMIYRSLMKDPDIVRLMAGHKDTRSFKEGLDQSLEAVRGMKAWCDERSVFFGVFDYNCSLKSETARRLAETCRDAKIPFHDTGFREFNARKGYRNSALDAHPNARAHLDIAERVLEGLRKFGLVP